MSTYQTDEEQVEALKKWWKENGLSVIGGAVLGLAIIGGWQGWMSYMQTQGEAASSHFETMRVSSMAGDQDKAVSSGQRLIGEFGDTAYGAFAGLELARLSYQKGQKEAARQHLQWVLDHGVDTALVELARLRLARLLVDMNDLDAADAIIAKSTSKAYAGAAAALRGDIAKLRGDTAGAYRAYQDALDQGVDDSDMVRMKMVDVGVQAQAS